MRKNANKPDEYNEMYNETSNTAAGMTRQRTMKAPVLSIWSATRSPRLSRMSNTPSMVTTTRTTENK